MKSRQQVCFFMRLLRAIYADFHYDDRTGYVLSGDGRQRESSLENPHATGVDGYAGSRFAGSRPIDSHSSAFIEKELAALALQYTRENLNEEELTQPVYKKLIDQRSRKVSGDETFTFSEPVKDLYRHILNRQRQWLVEKNRNTMTLDEAIVCKHLYYLYHEEERLLLR